MDAHTLKLFQRKALKSKREVLEALDDYSSHLALDKAHFSDDIFYRPVLIELIDRFKRKIQECDLAYLEKPFAAYEIVITNIDISLNAVEYTEIVFDENNELESTTASECLPIICIEARFISVEEFAQRLSIDIETAINLIKSRKIKCAQFGPAGWSIIETQNLPSEEYQSGTYIFIGEYGGLNSVAPLHKRTYAFEVFQLDSQSDLFDVWSLDSAGHLIERKQINSKELGSLEDLLIRSPYVLFVDKLIEVIDEKVVPPFQENPFLAISEEKILNFISQLDLPKETKRVLKAMAQNNCGENLFIATLEKLLKKEEFLAYLRENMPSKRTRFNVEYE